MRGFLVWGCACALVAGGSWKTAQADEPGELLNQVDAQNRVMTEQLSADVAARLRAVQVSAANDAGAAVDQLKQLADFVAAAPELTAEVRASLRGQIENALRSASRRAVEQEAAAGDYALAIRSRFRACVAELTERTVLDDRAGRTAYEVVADASQVAPALRQSLQPAASVFTEVVYGNRPGTPERYAAVVAADDAARTARVTV